MAEKRRRLRYGMIGGGSDSSVGVIHRNALRLNNEADLVAGIFSHNPDKSKKIAEDLGVTEDRAYATPEEMVAAELKREDKIDFVVICTPNCYHYRRIICTDTYIYRPSYLKGSRSIIP